MIQWVYEGALVARWQYLHIARDGSGFLYLYVQYRNGEPWKREVVCLTPFSIYDIEKIGTKTKEE